jgi:hypothetical protein
MNNKILLLGNTLLVPTDLNADGEISSKLLKVEQSLPAKQQWSNYKGCLLPKLREHREIMVMMATMHMYDTLMMRYSSNRIVKMARNIPRHRRQRQSFTDVAATTTPKDAITLLIDWDLKSENAETHTETEQHAFVVWKKDNN